MLRSKAVRVLLASFLGALLLLGSLEWLLRSVRPTIWGGPFRSVDGLILHKREPHRNKWGFTDVAHEFEPKTDRFRAVGLGDSMGDTPYDPEKNFHHVAQTTLRKKGVDRAEVINNCVAGYRLPDMRNMLKEYTLRYDPDLVFLSLTPEYASIDADEKKQVVINGMLTVVSRGEWAWHFRTYLKHWRVQMDRLLLGARKAQQPQARAGSLESLTAWAEQSGRSHLPPFVPRDLEPGSYGIDQYVRMAGGWDRFPNYRVDFPSDGDPGLVRVRQAVEALKEMKRIAEEQGARFAVVLHATETQVNEVLQRRVLAWKEIDPENVDFALPQRRYRARLEEAGIPCLDLLPKIGNHSHPPSLYRVRDLHLNGKGNRFVGRAIANWIIEQGWHEK